MRYLIILLALVLTFYPSTSYAQREKLCSPEINKRITVLNNLSSRLSSVKKMSDPQKNTLLSQISSNVTQLLSAKANCESDIGSEAVSAYPDGVLSKYRIFSFLAPQIRLLAAADTLQVLTDKLSDLHSSLSSRISSTLLTDMQAKITDAQKQYTLVQSTIATLTPEDYNSNPQNVKNTIKAAQIAINTGNKDIRSALLLARQIRSQL